MALRTRASSKGKSGAGLSRSTITESVDASTFQSGLAARRQAATASGVSGEPS